MQNIILHSTPIQDLKTIIGEAVREQLKDFHPPIPETPKQVEYITRKEVCARLRISLATLHLYTKEGIVTGYRIGGRILYKTSEVDNSVREVASLKYKHRGV